MLDVYAAGEAPIAGADGRAIARAVRSRGSVEPVFVESLDELQPVLDGLLEDGDLVLTMGAGDIGAYAAGLPICCAANRILRCTHDGRCTAMTCAANFVQNEPMSRHTSWRVGGPADQFFVPASIEDLSQFLRELDPRRRFSGTASAATCWCATAEFAAS